MNKAKKQSHKFNSLSRYTPVTPARTLYKTLKHKTSGFCVHPLSGTPQNGAVAIMWKDDCSKDRLQLDLFKLEGW